MPMLLLIPGRHAGLALMLALALGSCSAPGEHAEEAPETEAMSRQEKDSVIAGSRLPGAGVVRGALDASEAAGERAAAHDSIP